MKITPQLHREYTPEEIEAFRRRMETYRKLAEDGADTKSGLFVGWLTLGCLLAFLAGLIYLIWSSLGMP
jgi:hypothetical protein